MMSDSNNYAQSLFRTAAIFYGNDPSNFGSSNARNIQKLVESSLYHSTDKGMSIHDISVFISTNYLLDIDDSEITTVIKDPRNNDRYIVLSDFKIPHYVLTHKRRLSIESAQIAKSLDSYIDEYVQMESLSIEAKEIIIRYLYGLFTSNLESFRRLFQLKKAASLAIEINNDYTDSEASFINGFLLWDNKDKDQAVFNFASYALEFCMITNRKDSSNINEQLGLKEFYIDTNIVYRALGLNGEDRKQRTLQLLEKLQATKCKLHITTEAKTEFERSLKEKCDKLRKNHNPSVKSRVFQEFVTYDDIYSAYHRWCVSRVNTSVDIFEANVLSTFDTLRKNYSIQTDGDCPFVKEDKKDFLQRMATDIKSYSRRKTLLMAFHDALNVLWVEMKRMPNQFSLFSAKHFMLSSDKGLRYWDVVRNDGNSPRIIIHPSEWLSIILRYSHRTADDFKSFISFLTLRHNEAPLSNEELDIAINSIAEIAEDINVQRIACENYLKIAFDRKGQKLDESVIKELAKKEAERVLENKLKDADKNNKNLSEANALLTEENSSLKGSIEEQTKSSRVKIEELNRQKEALQNKSDKTEHELKARIVDLENKLRISEEGRKEDQENYKKLEISRVTKNWIIVRICIAIVLWCIIAIYIIASEEGDWFYAIKLYINNNTDLANLINVGIPALVGVASLTIFPWRLLRKRLFPKSDSMGLFE